MKWKIIGHSEDHFLVEFEDGSTLNFCATELVERRQRPAAPQPQMGKGVKLTGVAYAFDKDSELFAHTHDAATNHDIRVVSGTVMVRRAKSGDVLAHAGETVLLEPGEVHSIEASEPSTTLHMQLPG